MRLVLLSKVDVHLRNTSKYKSRWEVRPRSSTTVNFQFFFLEPDTARRMNFSSLQFFLVCLVLKHISALKKCDTIDRCTCLTDEGKISLWELARRDGVPR